MLIELQLFQEHIKMIYVHLKVVMDYKVFSHIVIKTFMELLTVLIMNKIIQKLTQIFSINMIEEILTIRKRIKLNSKRNTAYL